MAPYQDAVGDHIISNTPFRPIILCALNLLVGFTVSAPPDIITEGGTCLLFLPLSLSHSDVSSVIAHSSVLFLEEYLELNRNSLSSE